TLTVTTRKISERPSIEPHDLILIAVEGCPCQHLCVGCIRDAKWCTYRNASRTGRHATLFHKCAVDIVLSLKRARYAWLLLPPCQPFRTVRSDGRMIHGATGYFNTLVIKQ